MATLKMYLAILMNQSTQDKLTILMFILFIIATGFALSKEGSEKCFRITFYAMVVVIVLVGYSTFGTTFAVLFGK